MQQEGRKDANREQSNTQKRPDGETKETERVEKYQEMSWRKEGAGGDKELSVRDKVWEIEETLDMRNFERETHEREGYIEQTDRQLGQCMLTIKLNLTAC